MEIAEKNDIRKAIQFVWFFIAFVLNISINYRSVSTEMWSIHLFLTLIHTRAAWDPDSPNRLTSIYLLIYLNADDSQSKFAFNRHQRKIANFRCFHKKSGICIVSTKWIWHLRCFNKQKSAILDVFSIGMLIRITKCAPAYCKLCKHRRHWQQMCECETTITYHAI